MSENFQKQINQAGETLLKAIGGLSQIAKIHKDNNKLLMDSLRKFVLLIEKISGGNKSLSLHFHDGRFYFQEHKLFMRPDNVKFFNRMGQFFEERNIQGLSILVNQKDTAPKKIALFFRLFDHAGSQDDPSQWLSENIQKHNIDWISLLEIPPTLTGEEGIDPDDLEVRKVNVRKSYANILSSIKDTAHKLSANQGVGLRSSVRLVQRMVDLIRDNDSLFVGISTIRIYDDYTYAHSLNVAILAMCLGKRIGLSHHMLERLGMCGLFHDLGKVEIPKDVLNKQGKLNAEEFALIQTHSMHSARMILKIKANGDRKSKLLVPPFEHHMGVDYSGYPKVDLESGISLFGRIITIADVYDAVTSPRVYRSHAMSPDKALAMMMDQSGTQFDPILLKVFIRMLGRYPIGTAVQLTSGEIGVVIGGIENHFSRPRVQLLFRDDEKRYRKGVVVDLSERDSITNQYTHVIQSTMHPATIGIQPAEFIV